jgi:carbamate kinase
MRRNHVDSEVGPLVVAALGGNALLRRGEPFDLETQRRNVKRAAAAMAEIGRDHRVVITHGNGPQIGLLALQSEAIRDVRTYPLDVLGAESEGLIGYLLEQELGNEVPERPVVSLLTQVVVDALDPGFRAPTKPIGPEYTESEARRLTTERGWTMGQDGDAWRRVVASPAPRAIVELPVIQLLLDAGVLVIAAGGGGIPVVVDVHGGRHGVEAVVDKDWASALLARQLGSGTLLLLTDVPSVMRDWGTPNAAPIAETTPAELRNAVFASGSMGPKIDAASWFVSTSGGVAVIGAIDDAAAMLRGEAGTRITRGR